MVARPVVPHIGDGGEQLLLRNRPAGLRSYVIAQDEGGAPKPRKAQGDRFPLPCGKAVIPAAGTDNDGGAQPVGPQLRRILRRVCGQLRRPPFQPVPMESADRPAAILPYEGAGRKNFSAEFDKRNGYC